MCPSIGRPETPAANVETRICCPATSNLVGYPKRGSQELAGSAIWRTDVTVWSSSADAPSMSSYVEPEEAICRKAVRELADLDLKDHQTRLP
jgi:hypothetical protein